MPKLLSILAIAGIAVMLVGCQSAPAPENAGACVPTASGEASKKISVSGEASAVPTVDFPMGTSAGTTERSVVKKGDGRIADAGAVVTFSYVAFNGSTGDQVDAVGYEGAEFTQATVDEVALMPGLAKALLCASTGARIAAVIPPVDAFAEAGNEQFGIGPSDSIVFVIDVVAVAGDRADGEPLPPVEGMPEVELRETGEPMIDIPDAAPPAELTVALLKEGDGAIVGQGETVTIEYTGVIWESGEPFDSSWLRDDLVQLPTTEFVEGFGAALVGQSVGSQVEVVIPPDRGYGVEGNPAGGILGTDTLVFVIDILAVI